jgi:hypothetical protein
VKQAGTVPFRTSARVTHNSLPLYRLLLWTMKMKKAARLGGFFAMIRAFAQKQDLT